LNYIIKNKKGIEQNIVDPAVVFGDNRIDFNISPLALGYYVLEIKNDKNETFYLRFKVQ
jgi:DNA-binding sugar fermentation-stimulating protein